MVIYKKQTLQVVAKQSKKDIPLGSVCQVKITPKNIYGFVVQKRIKMLTVINHLVVD
jgi:hypothetical protein